MDTTPLWKAISHRVSAYSALSKDITVDVAIIGGGITGITAATELVSAGKKVAILEAEKIGGVTTGASTGNLYIAVQPFYQNIFSKFNFNTAKTIAHSRKFAIDYIENQVKEKNIACHFTRRPWYAYTAKNERASLKKELDLFNKMDIPIQSVSDLPLPFKFKQAIMMPNQARFNPLQYVISMATDLSQKGCLLFENTRITHLQEKDEGCTLKTDQATVTAQKIIIATHTPIGINPTQLFTAPYRSYVVAMPLKDGHYPEGHFWDLDRPPHATCTHAVSANSQHPELLLVAGSHHKTGQCENTSSCYAALENFLRKHFSVSDEVSYRWSAQHYQSADAVPYIGLANRFAKHTYLATGYFADGLVYGTVAGMILRDLILDEKNTWINTYQSNRFTPVASSKFLIKENTNVFLQYLKDFPLKSQTSPMINKGQGKIIEIDQTKYAVCRDEHNQLHMVSAVCPHMQCIVAWNQAERTWDCPCHGSRFTPDGKVIEGPAQGDLKKINKPEELI